ncbi:hypothetical protein COUCH_21810 [Couchioplanes caeruleus]|uniref:hypothetical protein n=1 Tax=Couchioplanes caeruleus TaxID=56438 RepID=UPI0020BE27A5|nr:hypothetical protein [Couchioplanes caeruleus]UQU61682.1 hypothetical protein COUCH_21810 [Couchioplanes caeruleus]
MSVEASVLERPAQRGQSAAPIRIAQVLADPAMLRIGSLAAALAVLAPVIAALL